MFHKRHGQIKLMQWSSRLLTQASLHTALALNDNKQSREQRTMQRTHPSRTGHQPERSEFARKYKMNRAGETTLISVLISLGLFHETYFDAQVSTTYFCLIAYSCTLYKLQVLIVNIATSFAAEVVHTITTIPVSESLGLKVQLLWFCT